MYTRASVHHTSLVSWCTTQRVCTTPVPGSVQPRCRGWGKGASRARCHQRPRQCPVGTEVSLLSLNSLSPPISICGRLIARPLLTKAAFHSRVSKAKLRPGVSDGRRGISQKNLNISRCYGRLPGLAGVGCVVVFPNTSGGILIQFYHSYITAQLRAYVILCFSRLFCSNNYVVLYKRISHKSRAGAENITKSFVAHQSGLCRRRWSPPHTLTDAADFRGFDAV